MLNQTQNKTIQFHNRTLTTFEHNNIHYVAMRPICENIGLSWSSQLQRMNRDDVLNSVVFMINTTGNDGKTYEMICLPIQYLNGWLFGIDTNRVKPEIKQTLITYKKECYQALFDYWHKGVATRKPQTLTAEHQATIKSLVLNRAKQLPKEQQAKATIMQWSALKSHFGKSYKKLDDDQFIEAVSLLARLPIEGELIIDNPINNRNLPSIQNSEETLALMIRLYSFCLQAYEMQQKLVSTGIDKQIRCDMGGHYLCNFNQPLGQAIRAAKAYIQHNAERLALVKCLNDLIN